MSISNFNNFSLLASPQLRADDRQNCCKSYDAFSNRLFATDFFLNTATLVKHIVYVILDYTPLVGLIYQVVRETLFGVNSETAAAELREITIKGMGGENFNVNVSSKDTIAELRAAVARSQNIPRYRIELFIVGTEDKLQDALSLKDSSIQAVIEVFMLIKPEINEKEALIALYNACGGATWTYSPNWNTAVPLSEWHGVTVVDGRVTNLQLANNNLTGTLPPEIGTLTALRYLGLHYNQLSGAIPQQIGALTSLETLSLGGNQLSGAIPPEIGALTALKNLLLPGNQLSGPIPSGIGNLTALERLQLGNNQLSGAIPQEIGALTVLQYLYLNNNLLSSAMPQEVRALDAFSVFGIMRGNQLTKT